MPVSWIKVDDKEVMNIDYRSLSDEEITIMAKEVAPMLHEQEDGKLLAIVNFDKTDISIKMYSTITTLTGDVFNQKHERAVFVGMSGIKKIMFNTYTRMFKTNLRIRDSEQEAIQYFEEYIAKSKISDTDV